MHLADNRITYQQDAILALLTHVEQAGQIPGYTHYVAQLQQWLNRITTGAPVTPDERAQDEQLAELSQLARFLAGLAIDFSTQARVNTDLDVSVTQFHARVLTTVREWMHRIELLTRQLDEQEERYRDPLSVGWTEAFTEQSPTAQLAGASIDPLHFSLTLPPATSTRIADQPVEVLMRVSPVHHPQGGIWHDPVLPDHRWTTWTADRGAPFLVWGDLLPSVAYNGVTYQGVMADLTMTYAGPITFTTMEIVPRGTYPITLLDVLAEITSEDGTTWRSLFTTGVPEISTVGLDQLVIEGLPLTTTTKVRLIWVQSHAMTRGLRTAPSSAGTFQDAPFIPAVTGPGRYGFELGLYGLKLRYQRYPGLSHGIFWSHDPGQTGGYHLTHHPMATARIRSTQVGSMPSSIIWTLYDARQHSAIPVLPVGTTLVREPARFVTENTIVTTFPVAVTRATQGIRPKLWINETPAPEYIANIPTSRTLTFLGFVPTPTDWITVEYVPAIGESVIVYQVVSRTGTNTVSIDGQDSDSTVYVSRAEADFAIDRNSLSNTFESVPLLARLDEWDYWFYHGAYPDNVGRTAYTIPPRYDLVKEAL